MSHTYIVAIREVHINLVEVTSEGPLSEEDAKEIAAQHSCSDSLDIEFSHTMDNDTWTVEEINKQEK